MSRRDRLSAFAEQVGFTVRVEPDVVVAEGVPCLFANRTVGSCTIEKSFDPASGQPNGRIGSAVHAVRITADEAQDGCVYNADGTPIGHHIGGDGQTWSNISIRKGSQDSPEDDVSPRGLIHRYAKQIVGVVSAAGYSETASLERQGQFKIPNTFEARAEIGPVQDRIRDQRIAIIGLGGTGAYVLDLIAKTPVLKIHLLDSDDVDWHNFMRAPGAPTAEEIESRQDVVYCALSAAEVPFIDSGVSITLEDHAVRGVVTTSAYTAGSRAWKDAIPNARGKGNVPGYRNVQLPEVNALAASLAVMEWRRRTEQYVSGSASFLHKFRIETPRIVTAD